MPGQEHYSSGKDESQLAGDDIDNAVKLHDLGLAKLQQGDVDAASELFRKAQACQSPPAKEGQPEAPEGEKLASVPSLDDWEKEDWESSLSERLQSALTSKITSSDQVLGTKKEEASSSRQFKGRGSNHYSPGDEPAQEEHTGTRDLQHVLEFYNLAATVKSQQLEDFLRPLQFGIVTPVIRWVDDNHALALFATAEEAKNVLEQKQTTFKIRPFSEASEAAHDKTDFELLPPKPRPKTTDVVARRMLGHALGRPDLVDRQGEQRLAQARKDKRQERRTREELKTSAWDD